MLSFKPSDVRPLQGADASPRGFACVGSCNFTQAGKLLVPGAPNEWTGSAGPTQLIKDVGELMVNASGFFSPKFPLESIMHAVTGCTPGFDFAAVDIVTDRNNLRKLLDFATDDPERGDFTIRVDRVGNSILFTRVEPKNKDYPKYPGFGHSFEDKYTKSTLPDTICHHRVVTYTFGRMRLLVRCEVDAVQQGGGEVSGTKLVNFKDATLKVERAGTFCATAPMMELKTKSARYAHEFNFPSAFGQMALSGTNLLALGLHERGNVREAPTLFSIDEIATKAGETARNLGLLAGLLKDIVAAVRKDKSNTQFVLQARGMGTGASTLCLNVASATPPLPESMAALFATDDAEVAKAMAAVSL